MSPSRLACLMQSDGSKLVVPIYSDIQPGGGGTYIAPQSVGMVAKWLEAHPEGVEPSGFDFAAMRDQCTEFVELTGNAGDVSTVSAVLQLSADR